MYSLLFSVRFWDDLHPCLKEIIDKFASTSTTRTPLWRREGMEKDMRHQVGDIFTLSLHSSHHPVDRDPEGYPGCVMYSPPDSSSDLNSKRHDHYIMKKDEYDDAVIRSELSHDGDADDAKGVDGSITPSTTTTTTTHHHLYVRVDKVSPADTAAAEEEDDVQHDYYYIVTTS